MTFDRSIQKRGTVAVAVSVAALLASSSAVAAAAKTGAEPSADAAPRVVAAPAVPAAARAWEPLWPLLASGAGVLCFVASRGSRR